METHDTLIVSDLHLEKGSRAGSRGHPVPRLDSLDTLARLRDVVQTYRPARVICLGDSFDDAHAGKRMMAADRDTLAEICALTREWVWISGNHDPSVPEFCDGLNLQQFELGPATLRHIPKMAKAEGWQIVGHFHPKTSISTGNYRFSGPCFCISKRLLIMPAFGAFTGGLSCSHPSIANLHETPPRTYMLHAKKVWRLP